MFDMNAFLEHQGNAMGRSLAAESSSQAGLALWLCSIESSQPMIEPPLLHF